MNLQFLKSLAIALVLAPTILGFAADAKPTKDWLRTQGSKIVDVEGRTVWITGINWFGYNTGTNTFDGLWSVNLGEALEAIADHGFNMLRIPISTELLHQWSNGEFPRANINLNTNPKLAGLNSLEVFDKVIDEADKIGLKIMIDVHSAKTNAMGHFHPLWYHDNITVDVFYNTWVWLAERYKNDDTILAFDLENEPHGKFYSDPNKSAIWDSSSHPNNWKAVAEELSNRILQVHPNILILIEGIETYPKNGAPYESKIEEDYHDNWWGGNLRGVKDHPIATQIPNQIVYSPHDYGPAVYKQPWFYEGFNKETLYEDVWRDNWFYLMENDTYPLLIGEWGGFLDGGDNQKWQEALRDFIVEHKIHHTYWCFNANSGDTGGLVDHDFKTWDEEKYQLIKPALWQSPSGKFIGLDHQTPLGSEGMSLSDL